MAIVIKEEHNLSNWLSSLTSESTLLHKAMLAELVIAVILTIIGSILFFINGKIFFLVLAGGAFFLALSHWYKKYENYRDSGHVKAGQRGEQIVNEIFEKELDHNYYIINDVDIAASGYKSQIDHIIIGPKGIYVIETKSWVGVLEGNEEDEEWRQTKFDRKGQQITLHIKSPISQNARHITTLKKLFNGKNISCADIYSIIIFTRKSTELKIKSQTPVLNIDDAVSYIAHNCPQQYYSGAEIANFIEAILPDYRIDQESQKFSHA